MKYQVEKQALILFEKFKCEDIPEDFLKIIIKTLTFNMSSLLKENSSNQKSKKSIAIIVSSKNIEDEKNENASIPHNNLIKLYRSDEGFYLNNIFQYLSSQSDENSKKLLKSHSEIIRRICFSHFLAVGRELVSESNELIKKSISDFFKKSARNKNLQPILEKDELDGEKSNQNEM